MNIQVCKMSDTGLSERCQKRVYDEGQIQNRDRQTFFLEGAGGLCTKKYIVSTCEVVGKLSHEGQWGDESCINPDMPQKLC